MTRPAVRRRLPTVGLWFNPAAPSGYPRPQALVGRWAPAARAQVLAYLRAGRTFASYRGWSFCRFGCGIAPRALGHRDLTDGASVWPEGLAHYVEAHDVRLPSDFVERALATAMPTSAPTARSAGLDDGPWLAWARAAGACLDLDGWTVPDADARARIAAELGAAAEIALCRADTREVVIALADGALEIRQLTARGRRPKRLAGWHAWPLAR